MNSRPQGLSAGDDEGGQFVGALYALAERAIRNRSRLRSADVRDIAHEAYQELSAECGSFPPLPTLDQGERAVKRIADRIQKRRSRREERQRQVEAEVSTKRRGREGKTVKVAVDPPRPPPRPTAGVPTLCPRLASLGAKTPHEAQLAERILVAALTVAPDILTVDQVGTFSLAYINRRSAGEIALTLRISSLAATRRLQRLSRKVEKRLAQQVVPLLPPEARARVVDAVFTGTPATKGGDSVTPLGADVCERVIAALEALIHRNPE